MELRPIYFIDSKGCSWLNLVSIKDLNKLLECHHESGNITKTKIVVGNTEVGYCKDFQHVDTYINLNLSMIKMDSTGVEIGAMVTILQKLSRL